MLKRTLLLLDMDGVLIDSRGYKEALRDTVDYFALRLGAIPPHLTDEEIACFEAYGMTNEWLSSAFCVAALLMAVVDQDSSVICATLEQTFEAAGQARLASARPDFSMLARWVHEQHPQGLYHSVDVLESLERIAPPELHGLLTELLADIHPPNAPVARIFQNLVLGQETFQDTYGLKSLLAAESYLRSKDRALLSEEMRMVLRKFIAHEAHGVAIYTARPSLPFAVPSVSFDGYPPEAEIGSQLLDLEDLPLVGEGHLRWFSDQKGLPSYAYCKPSPVHTLAALGAALIGDATSAIEASIRLRENGQVISPFQDLRRGHIEVVIFEDGLPGIQGGKEAIRLLQEAGLEVILTCVGITNNPAKSNSLAHGTDRVLSNINIALRDYIKNRQD